MAESNKPSSSNDDESIDQLTQEQYQKLEENLTIEFERIFNDLTDELMKEKLEKLSQRISVLKDENKKIDKHLKKLEAMNTK